MSVESAADRASFLDTDEHGVAATYNGVSTVNGIFENAFVTALDQLDAPVSMTRPEFQCQASDLDADPVSKSLVISGVSYTIVEAMPDGTGMTTLHLETV